MYLNASSSPKIWTSDASIMYAVPDEFGFDSMTSPL